MRTSRRIWLALALTLPLFLVAGCGGSDPTITPGADMEGASGDGGLLPLFNACMTNSQCQSGLCTQISYDRSPTPICTYMCDASNMNPKCPMGCNPKGYCKMPM